MKLQQINDSLRKIEAILFELSITKNPDVVEIISKHIGDGENVAIHKYTKSKRTYSIQYLTIWEEDNA